MDLDPAASGPREETFGGAGITSAQWYLANLMTLWIQQKLKMLCGFKHP